MILTFVSDIHLNLKNNKQWERNRFLSLFDHLASVSSSTIILGGDIFDLPKPTLEEIGLFYEGLAKISHKNLYIISGNHEDISDTKTVFSHLPSVGYNYLEKDMINVGGYNLYFVSHLYCKQILDFKPDLKSNRTNILFSHFRSNYGTFIKGEINVMEISEIFDYIFVGDIHHVYSPYENVFYPSSPYSIHYDLPRDYGIYHITLEDTFSFSHERLFLPCKVLKYVSEDEVLEGLNLPGDHIYKIIVKGSPSTKISSLLSKNTKVATFDYAPESPEEVSEKFTDLVNSLSSHIEQDITETVVKLLKASPEGLSEPLEVYIKKVLSSVTNK